MKSAHAFYLLSMAAGLCAPALSQDAQDLTIADPYTSNSSSNGFGTRGAYSPNDLTNSYGSDINSYGGRAAEDPYATVAPKTYRRYGGYDGGLSSYPYDSRAASNPYGRFEEPYGANRPTDTFGGYGDRTFGGYGDRSIDAPSGYDRYGDFGGASTSSPDDPDPALNPYEPTPNPYGDFTNPYSRRSSALPRNAALPTVRGQDSDFDAGLPATPGDSGAALDPFGRYIAPRAEQSSTNRGLANAPKLDNQGGLYSGSMSSDPSNARAVSNPAELGVHPSLSGGLGDPFTAANPNSPLRSPTP
jgi:hypothetical protein